MRACPDDGLLLAFCVGQISDREADLLHEHLDQCPTCVALVSDLLHAQGTAIDTPADRSRLDAALYAHGYLLEQRLGRGATSEVYKAKDASTSRSVAIKVLNGDIVTDERMQIRLQDEALLVNRLGHPAIVRILAYLPLPPDGGAIVMEYLEGQTLQALLQQRGGRLAELEACAICAEAASALAFAHRRGVVHRDIKPANLMLTERLPRVRLIDFGLAKVLQTEDGISYRLATITPGGEIVGTLAYVSPEQVDAARSVDGRADVYSLGATLYHLLSGAPPFVGRPLEVARAHVSQTPMELRERAPSVSVALDALVMWMLAKSPSSRPAMDEVAGSLGRLSNSGRIGD